VFDDHPSGQILALKLLHRFFLPLGRQNSPPSGRKTPASHFGLDQEILSQSLKKSRVIVCR
jgi:hypothetical protein